MHDAARVVEEDVRDGQRRRCGFEQNRRSTRIQGPDKLQTSSSKPRARFLRLHKPTAGVCRLEPGVYLEFGAWCFESWLPQLRTARSGDHLFVASNSLN